MGPFFILDVLKALHKFGGAVMKAKNGRVHDTIDMNITSLVKIATYSDDRAMFGLNTKIFPIGRP